QRGVGVGDAEVDRPLPGYAFGEKARGIHDPCEPALALRERRVAEVGRVAHDIGVPAESVAVEADGGVVVAGVQLEPARGASLTEDTEAWVGARLPDADGGPTGV